MREIPSSFSHPSPSPSVMSRDPDGINLPEEYGSQLEPSGTIPDEQDVAVMTAVTGSTDIVISEFAKEVEGKIVLDMKKFLGLPPPPPPSTKPPMKRTVVHRIKVQTPNAPSLAGESGSEQNEATVIQNTAEPSSCSKPATRSPSSSPRARDVVEVRLQPVESTNQSDVPLLDDLQGDDKSSHHPAGTNAGMDLSPKFVPEQTSKVAEQSPKSRSKQEKRAKKRGFFKKIFGGGKNRGSAPSSRSPTRRLPEQMEPESDPIAVDPPLTLTSPIVENNASPKSVQPVKQQAPPATSRSSSEDVTDQSRVVKNKFSFDMEGEQDNNTLDNEDSTSSIPQASPRQFQAFSLDPPDDDNGDPPENAGRPLASPTSYRGNRLYMNTTINDEEEQMRLETVRSRIAEIYGDKNEQEPIEHTSVDDESLPEEHLHQEEDHLEVKTQETRCVEPAGASPIVKYTRGNEQGLGSGDPVGETPKARANSRMLSNDPAGVSLCHKSTTPKSSSHVETSSMDKTESEIIGDSDHNEVDETKIDGSTNDKKQDHLSEPTPSDPSSTGLQLNGAEAEFGEGPIDSDAILSQKVTDSGMEEKIDLVKTQGSLSEERKIMKPDKNLKSSKHRSRLAVKKDGTGNLASKEKLVEMQKSGFNAASSNTSMAEKDHLTVAAAAFTNAKAIAYLHRLEGEPSPRHTYHSNYSIAPPLVDNPAALAKLRMFSAKKKKGKVERANKSKRPSPDEYSAANEKVKEELQGPPKKNYVTHDPRKQFVAYSRFQGRRPRKKNIEKENPESSTSDTVVFTAESEEALPGIDLKLVVASNKLARLAIARGTQPKLKKTDTNNRSKSLNRSIVSGNRFNFFPALESEIKNPVQRAGRRLLSKSAVPIQSSIRMFLAKKEALDRMWAIVQLQSHFRRWKCEAHFHANKKSAILVQKVFRGHKHREELKRKHSSATSIQKIVRGYLAALRAYETIYYVTRAQALARGYLVRNANARRAEAVKIMQAFCLKFLRRKNLAATLIQCRYREYRLRQDEARIRRARAIVTVQNIVRRWSARRAADLIRKSVYSYSITKFQALWRGFAYRNRREKAIAAKKIQILFKKHLAKTHHQKVVAATKIQATWRRFDAYSHFVFAIVDILLVQRKARQWLAKRKTSALRKEKAAVTLQSAWRRKKAQSNLLYSLVSIIIVQSVARRFLVKKQVQARIEKRQRSELLQHNKDLAAIAIQKSWRGFWGFSHFIIVKYEITRIQALMRGKIARDSFNLKLGCAILIQSVARRFLAQKVISARAAAKRVDRVVLASTAIELRERNSAKRIQFWWRIVMDYMKEKKAALVIERFFLYVKAEVDREIREMEKERIMKEKARRKQKALKGNFDREDRLNAGQQKAPPEVVKKKGRSQSAQKQRKPQKKSAENESQYESFRDHGLVEKTSRNREPPPEFLQLAPSADFSMVSNITNPSILDQYSNELKTPKTPIHEEKYKEVKSRSKNKMSTEDYIKKYGGSGMQTAPNSESKSQTKQFFSDEGKSKNRKSRRSNDGSLDINAQSHTKASTPRRGRAHDGKQMSLAIAGLENLDRRGKVPSTPRSRSGSTTPRDVSRSRREGSFSHMLPPVTPTRKKSAAILRSATADTECLTMDNDKMSIPPRPSPQKRSGTHSRGGHAVVVMKSHTDYMENNTFQEAHELMLLGDEYGEV